MASDIVNRESYIGEKHRHVREGYGIYTYENKFFKYEGEWKNGRKHGHGKFTLGDGSFYEGEFQDGEITGHGYKYFAMTGNTYSGQLHLGELQGQGVMKYHNGDVYQGQWNRNKREGHGIFRQADGSVYQGYYHNNRRHGEGTQIYSNGDRYDGDWVNDKRQGHGEARLSEGSIYDGQWRNDVYHGHGSMVHCSGVTYEGLWVSGYPAKIASKIVIKSLTSPHEVIQGQSFDIEVMLVDDEGEITEENGRELGVIAGYRYQPDEATKSATKEKSASGLFEVIEDMEEKPIPTPFGYSVISYPLTDVYNPEEINLDENSTNMSRSRTDLTDSQIPENEEATLGSESQEQETSKTESDQNKVESSDAVVSSELTSSDLHAVREGSVIGITLPPPVSTKRTQNGGVTFNNLVLTAAPPMYRPFLGLESRAGQSKTSRRSSKASDDRSSSKMKKLGDERYSPPGEYVIIVEDVTNPPFLGTRLEPAFLLVKVVLPKKTKRKSTSTSIKGPKK